MKRIYYHRSRLHLLSLMAKLKRRMASKQGKSNDAVMNNLTEKLQELNTAAEYLDHRLTNWKSNVNHKDWIKEGLSFNYL